MPVRVLPADPNLEHLKYQAKDLLKTRAARDAVAAQRIREFHPKWTKASDEEIFAAQFRLSDAQLAIAREYGFASWARLKRRVEKPKASDQVSLPHHERIEDPLFRRGVELIDAGDVEGLRAHLKKHPALTRKRVEFEGGNYFRNPSLLEFVAENPVRRGKLPKNIVEIAEVILDAGVEQSALDETLMLVATGRVPRECGVQTSLIDLLCDRGAYPYGAAQAAALLFELDAANALVHRGAEMTVPLAAALGRSDDAQRLLAKANSDQRHLALAVASQYGHVEIVRMLLDAGEDPNRFNPVGGHSHSTPLHQAAGNGHLGVVKLLVSRGARIDIKDILFRGTPAGWANYSGKKEVEAYLRSIEKTKAVRCE
ncbi:MAG TPA: ankyrin repeat domain-containing protein [Candidatus Sulfotelmatobacter sp.]|nr:ankyrin repeat domain-containing protein [Candidatus Sulfotelmatobacter sp.]